MTWTLPHAYPAAARVVMGPLLTLTRLYIVVDEIPAALAISDGPRRRLLAAQLVKTGATSLSPGPRFSAYCSHRRIPTSVAAVPPISGPGIDEPGIDEPGIDRYRARLTVLS